MTSSTTTTTTSNLPSDTLTVAKVKEAVERLKSLGEDPLRAYMRDHGFDPEKGGRIALPESMRDQFGLFGPPSYVCFSQVIKAPLLFMAPYLFLSA